MEENYTNPTESTEPKNTQPTEPAVENTASQDFEDFTISPDGSTRKIELTTDPTSGPEPYNPTRYSNNATYTPPSSYQTGNGQPYQSPNTQQQKPYTPPNAYQTPPRYTPPRNQYNNNGYSQNYQSSPNYHPPGQGTGYYQQPPVNVNVQVNAGMNVSPKSKVIMIILCCLGFIGFGGIHRFYAGKVGTGLLWFFTGGLCCLGTIIDLILILTDQFTDYYGYPIVYN